jgi:hypothetical protein
VRLRFTMDPGPWHSGGSPELALLGIVACRWSPVVAGERATAVLVDLGLWCRGHEISRATAKGGGGRRRTTMRSLGLGQEDLGPKMSTGRMVELGAQFIGAK